MLVEVSLRIRFGGRGLPQVRVRRWMLPRGVLAEPFGVVTLNSEFSASIMARPDKSRPGVLVAPNIYAHAPFTALSMPGSMLFNMLMTCQGKGTESFVVARNNDRIQLDRESHTNHIATIETP
jgi:hypothetical protein